MTCDDTHTACNARIKKEGGNARCCYCEPHEGCELRKEALANYGGSK